MPRSNDTRLASCSLSANQDLSGMTKSAAHFKLLVLLVIAACIVAVLKGLTSSASGDIAAGIRASAARLCEWMAEPPLSFARPANRRSGMTPALERRQHRETRAEGWRWGEPEKRRKEGLLDWRDEQRMWGARVA